MIVLEDAPLSCMTVANVFLSLCSRTWRHTGWLAQDFPALFVQWPQFTPARSARLLMIRNMWPFGFASSVGKIRRAVG